MAVILYARVSDPKQLERDLSIPAQLRIMKEHVRSRGWIVTATFQDVGTGRTLQDRSGLMAAVQLACKEKTVDALVVHRIDRVSRNVYNYLTLKGRLAKAGVRLVSIVEAFEANPMGEFIEHVMAAQAEFYSANLSMEIRKGLQERLEQGKWNSLPPLGYLKIQGRVVADDARAPHIRPGFLRWSTGLVTTRMLADELYASGLVTRSGKRVTHKDVSNMLHNPFYTGVMVVKGKRYAGSHPALVEPELFERCQEVFRQKRGNGRPRRHLVFVLAGKVACPKCAGMLIGEQHVKPSGRMYRYYRCHRAGCRFLTPTEPLDAAVCRRLSEWSVGGEAASVFRRRVVEQRAAEAKTREQKHLGLRAERRTLEERIAALASAYATGKVAAETFELEHAELRESLKATDWSLDTKPTIPEEPRGDELLLRTAEKLDEWLASDDVISKRQAVDAVVRRVSIMGDEPRLELNDEWRSTLSPSSIPIRVEHAVVLN